MQKKDTILVPELLAPAGDMEKLQTALHFGADAVYLSGKSFGLRAFAGNFDLPQIAEAVAAAHKLGRRVYATVNIFARNADFAAGNGLESHICGLSAAGVDALIIADPGVFALARRAVPDMKIHISTQANVTNAESARFWYEAGASRVCLARELSLSEVAEIKSAVPGLEIEVFAHGAMCVSYSGRCLLSDYLTGRRSNRGECAQVCRWGFKLVPEGRSAEDALGLEQDERGAYILNSKDLCMLGHLDKLAAAGVCSLKIEGRMKSSYYVGTVVNSYRRALDTLAADKFEPEKYTDEMLKCSHRSYETGFFFGSEAQTQFFPSSKAEATAQFCAVVRDWRAGKARVEMRNSFKVGDTLEVLSRGESFNKQFAVEEITAESGEALQVCNRVQQVVIINCPHEVCPNDILRAVQA